MRTVQGRDTQEKDKEGKKKAETGQGQGPILVSERYKEEKWGTDGRRTRRGMCDRKVGYGFCARYDNSLAEIT